MLRVVVIIVSIIIICNLIIFKEKADDKTGSAHVTLWRVRTMFVPPVIKKPYTISVDEGAFMAILCRRQQENVLRLSYKMPDILVDFNQIWNFSIDFS